MAFSNPLLAAHLKTGRIAHTYLFTGPEGETKREMVLAFTQALNCEKGVGAGPRTCPEMVESPNKDTGQPQGVAPTSCVSCRKIEKGVHPDVRWLGEDEKARSIKIEEIRQLIHGASLKPFEGKWKVFILKGADRLTLEAANALLKTLEEPPEHSVFILLVENKAHLLETIQSRAFEVRTPPLPEPNALDSAEVQAFHERGGAAFVERVRDHSRNELIDSLELLMLYLRDQSAAEYETYPPRSRKYLEALETVYRVQQALDSNVNQKLALTNLEIQLNRLLSVGAALRGRPANKECPQGGAPTSFIRGSS